MGPSLTRTRRLAIDGTVRMGDEGAVVAGADAGQLGALGGTDGGGGNAAVAEEGVEVGVDELQVGFEDAEGAGREDDLLDEVGELGV